METVKDLQTMLSSTALISVLGDRGAVAMHLAKYKEKGLVQFDRILSIPTAERIPALVKVHGIRYVATALCGALTAAFNNMNLRLGMNAHQVVELATDIIDEAAEDNLAIEDVLLFLQHVSRGKAGTIYDRMDIPTFFQLFEKYREDRYVAYKRIQYEKEVQYKGLGITDRTSHELDKEAHHLAAVEHYKNKYGTHKGTDQQDCPPGA